MLPCGTCDRLASVSPVHDERRRSLPDPHQVGTVLEGGLLASLTRWAAEARVDEAARQRERERWLRQQAAEESTMAGVLVDLAERDRPVLVTTAAGRSHRGVLTAVAIDFCALRTTQGIDVLVSVDGVSSVRTQPGDSPTTGDRALTLDLLLHEAMAALAADRPRVLVLARGDRQGIAGELRSVGRDVATVRLDGHPPALAYVPLTSVVEVASV